MAAFLRPAILRLLSAPHRSVIRVFAVYISYVQAAVTCLLLPDSRYRLVNQDLPRWSGDLTRPDSWLSASPACLTRPLCRGPPEPPGQSGEAKGEATTTQGEAEDKSLEPQSAETQDVKPSQAREEKEGKSESSVKAEGGSVKAEGGSVKAEGGSVKAESGSVKAEGKQGKGGDKKIDRQKKLHDLLASLANVKPIPVEPHIQLSQPKPRRKKEKPAEKTPQPASPPEPELDPALVSATQAVAESLGGDQKGTESELLSALRLHAPEATARASPSLSELFVGMKVERKPRGEEAREAPPHRPPYDPQAPRHSPARDQPRPPRRQHPAASPMHRTPVDLFGGKPVGIFKRQDTPSDPPSVASVLATWERLHTHRLAQTTLHPPTNAFVEMVHWTNEGKLWTFPIDNEIGKTSSSLCLEEEKQVGFHEHIFLERHLEGWCPARGPIRHFMELVCVGLSRNPHLTVHRKQAHIEWYRNYFSGKEELLTELGAIESPLFSLEPRREKTGTLSWLRASFLSPHTTLPLAVHRGPTPAPHHPAVPPVPPWAGEWRQGRGGLRAAFDSKKATSGRTAGRLLMRIMVQQCPQHHTTPKLSSSSVMGITLRTVRPAVD
ncbi:28S ribosomal protein S31, mitochondrial [Chionoecetes opilio]|uniref:Small ribosomal subunit protein mS31 n=1 Tax=Chionoecetes opilio TaxID=41210 RepID=A0A8J4YK50_CHIOP|nr:28S ribosomal protein S31, mitochondrial [Chionoecetes opilio]